MRKQIKNARFYERNGGNNIEEGDRVKIVGLPKEVFATVIRKGHKNHWVINIDGDVKTWSFVKKD